jgi:hypothetical protein
LTPVWWFAVPSAEPGVESLADSFARCRSNSDRQAGAVPDCADMTTPRPERPKLKYALTEIG